VVHDPATQILKCGCSPCFYREPQSLVKQLCAWIGFSDIEYRAAVPSDIEALEKIAHKACADALAAQLRPDADVTQIVLLRSRRTDNCLGAKAAYHNSRRVDWTVESQYLERARNRETQHGAAVERRGRGNHLTVNLADAMIPPAEFSSALHESEAQEFLSSPRTAAIEHIVKGCRPRAVDKRHRIDDISGRCSTEGDASRWAGHRRIVEYPLVLKTNA